MNALNRCQILLGRLTVVGLVAASSVVSGATVAQSAEAVAQTKQTTCAQQARATAMAEADEKSSAAATIAELAASNESFEILTAALETAGLVETLSGEGSFTVFAPTDAAFEALPEGTVEALLQPENRDQLVAILTYHVVSGNVMSSDLSSGSVDSLEGRPLEVMVSEQGVMVNDANVIQADVTASNGVVHVIDQVLLPPDL